MTISLATADALDALGLAIFDPHTDLNVGTPPNPALGTGIKSADPAIDAQYLALIAPVMLAIDGRVMAPGFRYSLNVTNALQGRPKHWYLAYLTEYNISNPAVSGPWPVQAGLTFIPDHPFGVANGVNSQGYTLAAAMCACICHAWAAIIRMWLSGNYPLAVSLP